MSKRPVDPFLKRAHHLWSADLDEEGKPRLLRAREEADFAMRALIAGPGASSTTHAQPRSASSVTTSVSHPPAYLVPRERTASEQEAELVEQYRLMTAAGDDVNFDGVADSHVLSAVMLNLSARAPTQWTAFTARLGPPEWARVIAHARAHGIERAATAALNHGLDTFGRRATLTRTAQVAPDGGGTLGDGHVSEKPVHQAQQVAVRELPDALQSALRAVGYGRPDIEVRPSDSYSAGGAGGAGKRDFTVAVDFASGQHKVLTGSWGGANMFNPGNQVDNDTVSRPMPPNSAVVKGSSGGGHPVWAYVLIHPASMQKMLPAGNEAPLTPQEKKALEAIAGLTSRGRKAEFDRERLGAYGPQNPIIQSLAQKGLVVIKPSGIAITLAGKNKRLQRNAQEDGSREQVLVIRIKPDGMATVKPADGPEQSAALSGTPAAEQAEPAGDAFGADVDAFGADASPASKEPYKLFEIPLDVLQPFIDLLPGDDVPEVIENAVGNSAGEDGELSLGGSSAPAEAPAADEPSDAPAADEPSDAPAADEPSAEASGADAFGADAPDAAPESGDDESFELDFGDEAEADDAEAGADGADDGEGEGADEASEANASPFGEGAEAAGEEDEAAGEGSDLGGDAEDEEQSDEPEVSPEMYDLYNDVVRGLQHVLDQARGLRRRLTRSAADPMNDGGIDTIIQSTQAFDPVLMDQAGVRVPANTMFRVNGAHSPHVDQSYGTHSLQHVPGTRIRLALLDARFAGRDIVPGYPYILVTADEFVKYFKRVTRPQPAPEPNVNEGWASLPGVPMGPLEGAPTAAPRSRAPTPAAQTNAGRPGLLDMANAKTYVPTTPRSPTPRVR